MVETACGAAQGQGNLAGPKLGGGRNVQVLAPRGDLDLQKRKGGILMMDDSLQQVDGCLSPRRIVPY